MRYFTSDTHYGHRNIIDFCDRPYADVHHMDVDLVNRAASTLDIDDELWHLGDVALGCLDDTLTNLASIAVEVTLVAGNHERWRQHGRMINVGVDAWGGRPVSEQTLCAQIEFGPADLAPLPWE